MQNKKPSVGEYEYLLELHIFIKLSAIINVHINSQLQTQCNFYSPCKTDGYSHKQNRDIKVVTKCKYA